MPSRGSGSQLAPVVHQRRHRPPGTERPKRFRPRFHYELIACGFRGHELVGTDVAEVRPEDALVVVQTHDVRWHRCLRCDSWLPLPIPDQPTKQHLPAREEIELPLRGRPLRDKFVLRLIAVDRGLHFLILGILAGAIFLFTAHRVQLQHAFFRVLADLQGGVGGPTEDTNRGVLGELRRLFSLSARRLEIAGVVISAYALLEGVEAVGLWFLQRWAEYVTFLATTALLPLEIYELTTRVTTLKVVALMVNLAVVIYLLFAKRLFGLRGGAGAERAVRERDSGWEALERTAPGASLRDLMIGQ